MISGPAIRGEFHSDPRSCAAYAEGAGIYRILPGAVALPADAADLATLAGWAAAQGLALIPRGAGSGMGGGNVGDGVVVDLTALADRPLDIHADRRIAHCGSAVTCLELNAAAGRLGLRLPPDPSSGRWATLGGMISTNAAGARSARYGSVRRWVRAVELVTADGDRLRLERGAPSPDVPAVRRFEAEAAPALRGAAGLIRSRFPHTRKNSSGYALDAWLETGDLLDLIVGSEGTLAFVTAADWLLDPVPRRTLGLRLTLGTLEGLGDLVAVTRELGPSAVELLDRTFLDLVGSRDRRIRKLVGSAEAVLLVEVERDNLPECVAAVAAIAEAARPFALRVETAASEEEATGLWALRHAASPILASLGEHRRSLQVIEDGCVPPERLGEYVRAVRAAAAERGIEVVLFGHAGDGHLHANLLPDVTRAGWETAVAALLSGVTGAVARLGGTVSGEHGDGRLRAPLLAQTYGPEVVELFRRVKAAFDPRGLLNPGIKLGDAPPIQRLKVGPDAAPLPPDIEAGLREIELQGGYATPRLELAGRAVH